MANTTLNTYSVDLVDDHYWRVGWKQVQTVVVTHPEKEPKIIYLWVQDAYNVAFTDILHFLEYMGMDILGDNDKLVRYDYEDCFDNEVSQSPFYDFIVSIVEGTYEMWIESAYNGRYIMNNSA